MSENSTALVLQLSTEDGVHRQQLAAFPNGDVYRRSFNGGTRTQWRWGHVDDLSDWTANFVTMSMSSPNPMIRVTRLVLIETSAAEVAESADKTFARTAQLRFTRVITALESETPSTPDGPNTALFITEWLQAISDNDAEWLERQTHASGTAIPVAPVAPAPEPVPVDENPHGWKYPEVSADGFVVRANGQRYRVRALAGRRDVDQLRKARLRGEHVFMWGNPGTGKTALVEAAFGTELVTMLGTEDVEPSDFTGTYVPRGGPGAYVWSDGALTEAMERGVPLFVDEGGVIAPKTMTTLFSVMDGRGQLRITANPDRGTIIAKPGFMVIMATNPHAPGVRISEALTSRFDHSMEVGTDYPMMRTLGVPDALVTIAENLHTRSVSGEDVWVPQARELLRAKDQIEAYGMEVAIGNLIAAAPEDDREVVIEVTHRTLGGTKPKWLTL